MTQEISAYGGAGLTIAARPDPAQGADEVEARPVTATPPASPTSPGAPGLNGRDRTDALLAALTEMAALSMRRQADVAVAVRRAGLALDQDAVAAALEQLGTDACIGPPLYLSDGGILVSVTVRGIEHLATTSHRHVTARLMSRGLA